ncbi:MAG: SPOR domain-containing protein [Candidatus Babeliales bacterium]
MMKKTFDGPCPCQDTTVLALNRTSVSRMVAASSVLCLFIFVTGYFWGKKHATQAFMTAVTEEALVDKMQVALNTIAPAPSPLDSLAMSNETSEDSSVQDAQSETQEVVTAEQVTTPGASDKQYVAKLIGFGSQRNANQFVKKLAHSGVSEVVVAPQTSRMAGGKKRTWYQVVTKPFADHQQLVALVDRIKQIEKLHDVRIVAQNA